MDILGFIFLGAIFFFLGAFLQSEILMGASIIFGGLLGIFLKLEQIRKQLEKNK